MKLKLINIFFCLGLITLFISCGVGRTSDEYTSIESYSSSSVKFEKEKVYLERFGFTLFKPKGWEVSGADSEREMLINVTLPSNESFTVITIEKFNEGELSLKASFDDFVKRNFESDNQMVILEKGKSNLLSNFSKAYFINAHRSINDRPTEVEVFFAVEQNEERYLFGALTELNEKTDNRLAIMIDCIKRFEVH